MSSFSLPFVQTALAASLLAGTALSLIGIFVLVRGISFAGLAASQLAALGAVVSAVIGLHYGGLGVAFACVGLGVVALAALSKSRSVPGDAWVASLYILGAGLSALILAKAPSGEAHSMTVFFGNLLALGQAEVWESLVVLLATVLLIGAWFHRWIWLSYDSLSPRVSRLNVGAWNLAFFALFAVSMTVAIHVFGVLLSFAYLLLPAVSGLLLARSMKALFAWILLTAWVSTIAGVALSVALDFPTGPFIASLMSMQALVVGALRQPS